MFSYNYQWKYIHKRNVMIVNYSLIIILLQFVFIVYIPIVCEINTTVKRQLILKMIVNIIKKVIAGNN